MYNDDGVLFSNFVFFSWFKYINSTVAKRGSVFIGLMTLMVQYGPDIKGCLNVRIIISLQVVIKRPLKGNIHVI